MDKYGSSPIDVLGYKGDIIWKYFPEGQRYQGKEIPPHWTCGWKVTVNGKQYGDWITVSEPTAELSDKTRTEAESVMTQHARESINLVLEQEKGKTDGNR